MSHAGDALERWRAQLNVRSEEDPADARKEEQDDGQGGDTEMEAPEYEFLNEAGGRQRGDQQALAPATEEQAAGGRLPDREATAEADDAVNIEDDVMEEAPSAPQQGAEKVIQHRDSNLETWTLTFFAFSSLPPRVFPCVGAAVSFCQVLLDDVYEVSQLAFNLIIPKYRCYSLKPVVEQSQQTRTLMLNINPVNLLAWMRIVSST